MTRLWLFSPVAAMVGGAGYIGFQMGQPISETDVINHQATAWVKTGPNGAALTDCVARSTAQDNLWMVITCTHENGETRHVPIGQRGDVTSLEDVPDV